MADASAAHPVEGLGWRGEIREHPGHEGHVAVEIAGAGVFDVPADALVARPDGSYLLLRTLASLRDAMPGTRDETRIPVVSEKLRVETRDVEKGRVVVHVAPEEHVERVVVPLRDETVEVQRVPVGRFVDRPEPERHEGDVLVVPVHEEVLVVEKKLRLVEELRIVRRAGERRERRDVPVRVERATVMRRR